MTNTYTKIEFSDGTSEYGSFIGTGYGKTKVAAPKIGDVVLVSTKSGETHSRTIRRIIKEFASGVKVVFVKDEAIAAAAQAKYAATVAANQSSAGSYLGKRSSNVNGSPLNFGNGLGGWCNLCESNCYGDCQANQH